MPQLTRWSLVPSESACARADGGRESRGDAAGQAISTTDPLGDVSTRTLDAGGNVVTEVDPLGRVTRLGYDSLDRVLHVVDAMGNVTTHTYDASGRKMMITDANAIAHRNPPLHPLH